MACLLCAFIFVAHNAFFRQIWFDEALTIMEFTVRPKTVADIYRLYCIPNNHIVFNMLQRLWLDLLQCVLPVITDFVFRILPAMFSLAAVFVFYFIVRLKCGMHSAFLVAFCLVLSLPFEIYSVAVRGYMLSFLIALLSFLFCYKMNKTGGKAFGLLYFLSAFFLAGTIPSNIIVLATFAIYFFPIKNIRKALGWEFIVTVLAPPLAFLFFYLPIYSSFLKQLQLKEGWSSGFQSATVVYGAFIVSFLPLILFAAPGFICLLRKKKTRALAILRMTIFLIPLPPLFIFHPAPFPRVFFPLWAIWAFLLAIPLNVSFALLQRRLGKRSAISAVVALAAVAFIWFQAERHWRGELSDIFIRGAGLDDYFEPYYAKNDFVPFYAASTIKKLKIPAFISFDADPYSILFYAKIMGIADTDRLLLFDNPRRKIERADLGEQFLIIVRDQRDLKRAMERFSVEIKEPICTASHQKIFMAAPALRFKKDNNKENEKKKNNAYY